MAPSPGNRIRTVLIVVVLLAVPIVLIALFYPSLPVISVPRLGTSGHYMKEIDKRLYYVAALIPAILYLRLKSDS
jgi:hypothetical protein